MRFLPTVIAGLAFAASLVFTIGAFRDLMQSEEPVFAGPGEYVFTATHAGDHTLWHHTSGTFDGAFIVRDPGLPGGTEISISQRGTDIPTRAYGNHTSSRPSGEKISVLAFTVPTPGEYLVTMRGFEEKRFFSVTEGLGLRGLFAAISGCFASIAALLVSVTLLILALTGTFPRRAPPATAEPPRAVR